MQRRPPLLPHRKDSMVNYTLIRLACSLAALFGPNYGTVAFAPGFPIAVPKTGCALVVGSVRAERGFMLHSATVTSFMNGDEARTVNSVFHADGAFATIISGLAPGTNYEVRVEVVVNRPGETWTLARSTTITAR